MKKSIPYIVGGVVGMGLAFAMFLIWQNYKQGHWKRPFNEVFMFRLYPSLTIGICLSLGISILWIMSHATSDESIRDSRARRER